MSDATTIRAIPVLPVSDVETAAQWYSDKLDFRVGHLNRDLDGEEPTNYAVLHAGPVELHLVRAPEVSRPSGAGMCILGVRGIDSLHDRLREAGARILKSVEFRPWGARECWIEDPFGTRVVLSEASGRRAA